MKTLTRMASALAVSAGLAMAAFAGPAAAGAPAPLTYKVINSSAGSLHANFTLIMGEKEAILVDTPFLRSDAYRVAAEVLESGKTLTTIIITHGHPDHVFGASALKEVFPNVKVIAQPQIVDDTWAGYRGRYDFWAPQIGALAPQNFVMPTVHKEPTLMLEGKEIQLIGPVQTDDANGTLVHVPSLRLVATGDALFNQVHVYWGGANRAARDRWIATLDRIAGLNPQVVVPGHAKPGTANDMSAVTYTRAYLQRINTAIPQINSTGDYISIMRKDFPQAMDFQGDFILNSTAATALAQKKAGG